MNAGGDEQHQRAEHREHPGRDRDGGEEDVHRVLEQVLVGVDAAVGEDGEQFARVTDCPSREGDRGYPGQHSQGQHRGRAEREADQVEREMEPARPLAQEDERQDDGDDQHNAEQRAESTIDGGRCDDAACDPNDNQRVLAALDWLSGRGP